MADIRINSLPSTATSFNTDDYIAIDGASGGTRKMLAATLPLTDVTLGGSSGPSVKSSLSARAPRQGLVFDGTAGATVANVPAFGTADFTFSGVINSKTIPALTIITEADSNGFGLRFESNGLLIAYQRGGLDKVTATTAVTAGKSVAFSYVRSSGVGTFYINGIAAGSDPDGTNYSAGNYVLAPSGNLTGTLSVLIYNRALSASEVVALYESGAPAGADYPSQVAGTALVTGDNSTFASNTGFWQLGGSSFIVPGKAVIPSASYVGNGSLFKAGYRYRVSVNVIGISGTVGLGDSVTTLAAWTTLGVKTVEVTATGNYFNIGTSAGNTAEIDDVTVVPLGLLLAPDAAQAGGGLVWYDTSGNAANISWTSGVSWNVPSSQKTASGWTFAGPIAADSTSTTAAVSGTSTGSANMAEFGITSESGRAFLYRSDAIGLIIGSAKTAAAQKPIIFATGSDAADRYMTLTGSGNLLIGTTTDTGYKLNVKGASDAQMMLDVASGSQYTTLAFANNGSGKGFVYWDNTNNGLFAGTYASNASLKFNTGLGVLALTLDSSQNATFAGSATIGDGAAKGLTVDSGSGQNLFVMKQAGTSKWVQYLNSGSLIWYNTNLGANALTLDTATSNATFAGAIAIGNTVQTAAGVSSTHKVTISIGGTTYYLLATNV